MSEPIFCFDGADEAMQQAYQNAQASFKYFWRELSWEGRRIVPALAWAMIKLPFTDGPRSDDNPECEHMWVNEVDFDGYTLTGALVNEPNWLTSVKKGDAVSVLFSQLEDWMMATDDKAYGGHTVQLMRSRMSRKQQQEHDKAWGLEFGDASEVRIERHGKGGAEGFVDHPMCVNMLPKIEAQIRKQPSLAKDVTDDKDWSWLHIEAMAGNLGVVQLLLKYGADVNAKTPDGRDAAALARGIGWNEIADYLSRL